MAIPALAILENPYLAPKISGYDSTRKQFSPDDFQMFNESFEDLRATVIGVSKDSCERHGKFSDKEGLRFLLLSDEGGRLSEDFGVWKEKINYGKKYMGIERSTFIIDPMGHIVAEWRKVKVANHVKEVLETLKKCQRNMIQPKFV